MKPTSRRTLATFALQAALALALASGALAAPKADIDSPDKRKLTVDAAEKLSRPVDTPAPLTLASNPFFPVGFDLPDADELAALRAAGKSLPGASPTAPAVLSDSDVLSKIADKIVPTGTIFVGGQPMLMFGKKFVKVGTHFTVTYSGSSYDVALTSIDRTTFTLRLNRQEITRLIQTGK